MMERGVLEKDEGECTESIAADCSDGRRTHAREWRWYYL